MADTLYAPRPVRFEDKSWPDSQPETIRDSPSKGLVVTGAADSGVPPSAQNSLFAALSLSSSLSNPVWAVMIAILAVLPPLLPGLLKYVAPRIKSIGIPGFFEMSFSDLGVASYSSGRIVDQLQGISELTTAPEYGSMMTSYSSTIIAAIEDLQGTKDEILVVDLGQGRSWISSNLYFLALLATMKTSVRLVAFIETRHAPETFIGMCFPGELVDALGRAFPDLDKAAKDSNLYTLPLDLGLGQAFFGTLRTICEARQEYQPVGASYLTSATLLPLLGTRIRRQQIDWKEPLLEADYRMIILSDYPYTAAVDDGRLTSVISQERVALLLARELMKSRG